MIYIISSICCIDFQIACDRNYQAKGEERKADFIDCQAWRQTAEFIARYFHKGSMIAIEGCIQTNNYTDNKGNKRKSVTVVVNNVSFCGSRADGGNQNNLDSKSEQNYSAATNSDFEEIIDDNDDLPF